MRCGVASHRRPLAGERCDQSPHNHDDGQPEREKGEQAGTDRIGQQSERGRCSDDKQGSAAQNKDRKPDPEQPCE